MQIDLKEMFRRWFGSTGKPKIRYPVLNFKCDRMVLFKNPPKQVVVHSWATPAHRDVGLEDVHQWHLSRGWAGAGYHFGIRRDGTLEYGRPLKYVGSGVQGHNSYTVHVGMAGGVDHRGNPEMNFTGAQFQTLYWLLKEGPLKEIAKRNPPVGHRDLAGSVCPSFNVGKWWKFGVRSFK